MWSDEGCMALVGLVLLFGLGIGLVVVLLYVLSYILPIIFEYWAVILIVFFYCIFGVILYCIIEFIKNGEGIGVTICLAIALVWGYVGYAVWKNVPRTTSQADNSASPKAQQAAATAAARQSTASKYNVGDIITFGSYPFYEDGREKAIDWKILDIDADNNALLISDYCLDNVKYNEKDKNIIGERITWEDSTIRQWLNETFINKAFTPKQRSKIINDTNDKLFLLSIDEVNKYFNNDNDRIAYPTPYAKGKKSVNGNLLVSDKYVSADRGGSCWWWLRSPGYMLNFAALVLCDGNVLSYGFYVNYDIYAVRPAFKINLKNIEAERQRKAEEAKRKKEERKARKLAAQQAAAAKAAARQYKVGDKIYNVGNIITFGSYPFYADGSKKAIDWKILDIDENGDALVISDYALDNVKYNKRNRAITWEDSSIRKWLNKTFINKAFTAEQKSKIIESLIENKDNPIENTKGGNATNDKLFLLSIEEVSKYFSNDKERIAYPTPYAKSKESMNGNLLVSSDYGSCWWWLRSPGIYQGGAAGVRSVGEVNSFGSGVASDDIAVRPAFKINLNNF